MANPQSVFVTDASDNPIAVDLTYDAANMRLTLTPGAPLAPNSQVKVHITADVKDLAGNSLADFTASFTTATGSTGDTTSPTVVSINPADGATDIDVGSPIVVGFSEAIDPATLVG